MMEDRKGELAVVWAGGSLIRCISSGELYGFEIPMGTEYFIDKPWFGANRAAADSSIMELRLADGGLLTIQGRLVICEVCGEPATGTVQCIEPAGVHGYCQEHYAAAVHPGGITFAVSLDDQPESLAEKIQTRLDWLLPIDDATVDVQIEHGDQGTMVKASYDFPGVDGILTLEIELYPGGINGRDQLRVFCGQIAVAAMEAYREMVDSVNES